MFCYVYNDAFGEEKYSLSSFVLGLNILLLIIILLRLFIPINESWVKTYKLRQFFRKKEEGKIKSE